MYFVGSYNESIFNPFFVPSWIWGCFCVNREKINFPRPDFVDSEIVIWGLTSLTDFYKSSPFVQKTTCVRLSKGNLFCSNNTPEIYIFNSLRHQKLLLVAKQLQDSTFYINSEDIGISKLVSQVKLLPSLFELKDNDIIFMSTIIKKLPEM